LNLYEVIRWGNESDHPLTGGPDGPDTCFLVRASTPEQAAALADAVLAGMPCQFVQGWSHAVYLLGADAASNPDSRVLRGPYVQHAHCYDWRSWHRTARDDPWVELESATPLPRPRTP
jgi:hypothetical protein